MLFQLNQNLKDYVSHWNYHRIELNYGIIGPSGMFAGTIFIICTIIICSWKYISNNYRWHIIIAAFINSPLYFFFCAAGELRNLSLCYVGLIVMMGTAFETHFANREEQVGAPV